MGVQGKPITSLQHADQITHYLLTHGDLILICDLFLGLSHLQSKQIWTILGKNTGTELNTHERKRIAA